MELQCALTVRDKLAEKLANAEREAAQLRDAEIIARDKSRQAAQDIEDLRAKVNSTEQKTSSIREELHQALSEREQLEAAVAEGALALSAQQSQLADLHGQVEALQSQLAGACELLETKRQHELKLQQEKQEVVVTLASFQEHHNCEDNEKLRLIAQLEVAVDKLSKQIQSTEMELGAEQGSTAELQAHNKALRQQLAGAELQRIELHNTIQELKGNIRVYCRVRPNTEGTDEALREAPEPNKLVVQHGLDSYAFTFDKVFGMNTEQADVFDEVAGLIQSALDGYKVCIFAYGQTGSGKTYTMQGTDEKGRAGLIPRALMAIFNATEDMRNRGWTWSVKVSFIEVYNESLRDLLRGSGDAAAGPTGAAGPTDGHVIAQHDAWGTMVTGMSCVEVDSIEKINTLMARAAKQRAVGATDCNANSSRSHSIFALYLKGTNHLAGTEIHGALHLVDLAGSERLDKSGSTGERLKETRNINRSLSSLADVFAAKAEGRSHVPFRNSKLTHLMEPCLSGQGKCLMLVSVQPELGNAHETLCSLRFAKQVSQCNTGGKPRRSVKNLNACLSPRAAPPAQVPAGKKVGQSMTASPRDTVGPRQGRRRSESCSESRRQSDTADASPRRHVKSTESVDQKSPRQVRSGSKTQSRPSLLERRSSGAASKPSTGSST